MSTGKTLLDAAVKRGTNKFLDKFNEKFDKKSKLIKREFEKGCGSDPFKNQENPLKVPDGSDENFCESLDKFFETFHGWREDAFTENSESCNQRVIDQMKTRRGRWERHIKNFAKCPSNEEE